MCEISGDDEGTAYVYRVKERRAAKPHRCQACAAVILPGDRYCYGSGVSDHSGFSERACLDCAKIRKAFGEAHRYWPAFTDLSSVLHDCVRDGGPEPETIGWKRDLAAITERRDAAACARGATIAFAELLGAPAYKPGDALRGGDL
jgi:hypothetical protein